MSRIWKLPINIPESVQVDINWSSVTVKWPKWELTNIFPKEVDIKKEESQVILSISDDSHKNLWGLVRSLLSNMVDGVVEWFEKKLVIMWVGYSAKLNGNTLTLNLGYSHPIEYNLPEWITAAVEKDPKGSEMLSISWIDKQLVGQVSSNIRFLRPPEPYKWKWIRYQWEAVKIKVWKTAKK